MKAATGASETELGLALIFVGVGALPAMLLTGLLVDRLGGRALPAALLVFAAVAVLPGLAGSVAQLSLFMLLVGAASGAVDVAMNSAVSADEAAGDRRTMQKAHASFSAAVVVAAISVGLAREFGASRAHVLLAAGTGLAAAAWANRMRQGRGHARAAGRPRLTLSPALALLGVLAAGAFFLESGVQSWSALYLEDVLGGSPAVGGLGPALFAAAMALGRTFGDSLALRLGDRLLLVAGSAGGALGLVVVAVAPAVPLALIGFIIAGGGIAVVAPAIFGAAGRGAGDRQRGSSVASVTTVAYLGFLAGPPLMGAVSGVAGLRLAWLALTVVALFAAVAAATLPLAAAALAPRHSRSRA